MINRILIGGSVLVLGILLFLHWYIPSEITAVSVVVDITDEKVSTPQYEDIESLLGLKENIWKGSVFRYSTLTDVSLNESSMVLLPAQKFYLSNEFERAKAVNEFSNSIAKLLSSNSEKEKQNSSLYLPIAESLYFLKDTKADQKFLLIYSDLMENDNDLSLYDAKLLQTMIDNPDSLLKRYEEKRPLPDLTGITVYLIYRPINIESDARFQIVSKFYKNMFEDSGAKVYIQANL